MKKKLNGSKPAAPPAPAAVPDIHDLVPALPQEIERGLAGFVDAVADFAEASERLRRAVAEARRLRDGLRTFAARQVDEAYSKIPFVVAAANDEQCAALGTMTDFALMILRRTMLLAELGFGEGSAFFASVVSASEDVLRLADIPENDVESGLFDMADADQLSGAALRLAAGCREALKNWHAASDAKR
jgi:hypothetical protein